MCLGIAKLTLVFLIINVAECLEILSSQDLCEADIEHKDCMDVLNSGRNSTGVYTIHPKGLPALQVMCDMETRGGGWMIFQRRMDGSVDFYRDWYEYGRGFGNVYGEYWLGLNNLHTLTHSSPQELYISVEDMDYEDRYAHYDFFAVASEWNKFNLDLGSYFGTAGDSLSYHRGQDFGTKDVDNDEHAGICGEIVKGAWWYKSCYESNLNGLYLTGPSDKYGLAWSKWKGPKYSMKTSLMMIRPRF